MMNYNISFLRNLAIVAIVLHHTICMYYGWPPNAGLSSNQETLSFIFGQASNFGIGVFTFISGYVLYYQSKKVESFLIFLKKKIMRILFPCFVMALCYQLLFPQFMNVGAIYRPSCINGTPLWYLPMIFLCMLTASSLFYTKHPLKLMFVCWVLFKLIGHFTQQLTLNAFFWYFPIFLTGYFCCAHKIDLFIKNKGLIFKIISGGIIAMLLIIIYNVNLACFNYIKMFLWAISTFICVTMCRDEHNMGVIGKQISKQSFTIYLLHQFVINTLLFFHIPHGMTFIWGACLTFVSAFVIPCLMGVCYDYIYKNSITFKK